MAALLISVVAAFRPSSVGVLWLRSLFLFFAVSVRCLLCEC